jgi:hypothetical protein
MDHVINNPLKEAFSDPTTQDFWQKDSEIAEGFHRSVKRITLLREKCMELGID